MERGGTLTVRAKPYEPRTSSVSVADGRHAPTIAEVLAALGEETGSALAAPGTSTARLTRKADVRFEQQAAEAVYYQGLRLVTATYRYHCAGNDTGGEGSVTTWDTDSLSTGLIDCLRPAEENPSSELADLATEKRCPADSPARLLSRP